MYMYSQVDINRFYISFYRAIVQAVHPPWLSLASDIDQLHTKAIRLSEKLPTKLYLQNYSLPMPWPTHQGLTALVAG